MSFVSSILYSSKSYAFLDDLGFSRTGLQYGKTNTVHIMFKLNIMSSEHSKLMIFSTLIYNTHNI